MPCEAQSTTGSGPGEGPAAVRLASEFASYQTSAEDVPLGFFDYEAGARILEGVSLRDLGDIHSDRGEAAEVAGERLSHAVYLCRRAGSFPLVFGGDHSLSFAAVRGLGGPVDVLHIDAHSDIMEAERHLLPTSGSVVRALLHEEYVRRLVTVGVRGIFQVEQRPLRDGHTVISARRFREMGPEGVAELISGPCYISFDIDALDPSVAPGVNRPVPGGLSTEEVCGIFRAVARRAPVIGADIVELSPRHDLNMRTARIAVELSLRLLAEIFSNQGADRNGKLAAAMQSR
jgi:arginase family enzyme